MSAFAITLSNPLLRQLGGDARQLLLYFGIRHRLEFVKSLHSPTGGVLLCNEQTPDGMSIQRQLAIKHGLTNWAQQDVTHEALILQRLIGAEHVVQLVRLTPFGQPVGPNGLSRPFFVMEVAQGGPISQWVGQELDNTVLWSLFLCCEL